MKYAKLAPTIIAILFFLVYGAMNLKAQSGTLFTVDHNSDTHDAFAGDGLCLDADGKCTLRAAIEEANAYPFLDAINFSLPGNSSTIDLTIGELLITSDIAIIGPGATRLRIQRSVQASGTFRIFHIAPNSGSRIMFRGFLLERGNAIGNNGGGILIEGGNQVNVIDLAIRGNTATRGGGIANSGTVGITRTFFQVNSGISGNSINGSGGGIFNFKGATAFVANSTFDSNDAFAGGAIYNQGVLNLVNITSSRNNSSTFGCSILNAASGSANVLNTIIGMDSSATVSSLWGAFTSFGNNLITDARNSTGFTDGVNNDQVSDNNTIDAMLGDPALNGGQTENRELLPGSPAIDTGNSCVFDRSCISPFQNISLFTDQRVNHRRAGGFGIVDVGAFESQTFVFGSGSGIGIFGNNARLAGSLVILTHAETNDKRYRTVIPTGFTSFRNLINRDPYILELKSKRAGLSSLFVLDLDLLLAPPLPGISPNITIMRTLEPFGEGVLR